MTKKSKPDKKPWIDPDDAPEWTEEHFHAAAVYDGNKLVREAKGSWSKPGRPKSDNPKKQITLRLDAEIIEYFRATGKGWHSRINNELRKALGL